MSRTKDDANVFIKMRVTEEERDKIRRWSEENMISISDMIRLGLNTIGGLNLECGNKKRKTKERTS